MFSKNAIFNINVLDYEEHQGEYLQQCGQGDRIKILAAARVALAAEEKGRRDVMDESYRCIGKMIVRSLAYNAIRRARVAAEES